MPLPRSDTFPRAESKQVDKAGSPKLWGSFPRVPLFLLALIFQVCQRPWLLFFTPSHAQLPHPAWAVGSGDW